MRILLISWEYPPFVVGGMGKHVAELLPALAVLAKTQDDLYVDVLTTRSAGGAALEQVSEHVTIYRTDIPPIDPSDLFNSVIEGNHTLEARARRLAEVYRYDVIHVHDWLTARAGITLKHEWKTPLLVTIHATERGRHQSHLPNVMSQQINQLEWEVCYEAWHIIVCSGYMSGELRGYFNIPLDKISVIPNGIDPTPLQTCDSAEVKRLRERYAPNGERLLFFVGRITPEKGLQVLLRAMPFIMRQHADTRLLVAGKNSEQMKPLVDELKLGRRVEILGFISDQQRNCLYAAVDVAIFPSLYEPFGIVALEAMAAGCNVIASDVGGLSEVVHHRINGLTVMANNPQSVAWAVDQLFRDPIQAVKWRAEALNEVVTLYDWAKIAIRTVDLYRTVHNDRLNTDW
ncbi:MAG: glycosyltransferase family 4 protein [Caldilineaceae bacterium]|nr:glycosyltransferase family 4 protein [Caldilineaceae bacterium]